MRARCCWFMCGALHVALVCSLERAAAQTCVTPPAFAGVGSAVNARTENCAVQLSWSPAAPSCGGTIRYAIHRGTRSDFVPSAENRIVTSLGATSFTDDAALTDGQTYWYVVRASEISGGVIQATNSVSVSSDVTGPDGPVIRYIDDFDGNRPVNASAYWLANSPTLGINTCNPHSPTHAYWFGAIDGACDGWYPRDSNAVLVLGGDGSTPGINGFSIPIRPITATLSFHQAGYIEGGYDFVHLSYSEVGANGPWTTLRTWTGTVAPDTVDLSGHAGKTLWFAWRYETDSIVEYAGASLDDVQISIDAVKVCATYSPPPRPPHHLAFSVQPSDTVTGTPFPEVVAVSVLDDLGNLVETPVTVSLTLFGPTSGATLSGTIAQTTVGGVATFGDIAIDQTGPDYGLRAAVTGIAPVDSAPFDVAVAASERLVIVDAPNSEIVAGSPFSVEVVVRDAFGNTATNGAPRTVSLALEGGDGSLSGTASDETVNGVAHFDDLVLDRAERGLTLRAQAGAFVARTSPFDVVHAPASTLDVELEAPVRQGARATATVTARDAFGNVATDDERAIAVTSSDIVAQLPAPAALYYGRVQLNVVFATSGTQTLTVTDTQDATLTGSHDVEVVAVDTPTVTLLTPRDGETVRGEVQIIAAATVGVGTAIESLSISVDGEVVSTTSSTVIDATWNAPEAEAGTTHVITAVVIDQAGNVVTSIPVTVTIASAEAPAGGGCSAARGSGDAPIWLVVVLAWLVRSFVRTAGSLRLSPRRSKPRGTAQCPARPARATSSRAQSYGENSQ